MTTDETPVIWEAPCQGCGGIIFTDEHITGRPYFGTCYDCGGEASDDWRVSDEPHPALWGMGGDR